MILFFFYTQVGWWLPLGPAWPRLVLTAGLIGTVSLLEAISIAKALAELSGDAVNADQELLGANLVGCHTGDGSITAATCCANCKKGFHVWRAWQASSPDPLDEVLDPDVLG